jgi:hypothetical protein
MRLISLIRQNHIIFLIIILWVHNYILIVHSFLKDEFHYTFNHALFGILQFLYVDMTYKKSEQN